VSLSAGECLKASDTLLLARVWPRERMKKPLKRNVDTKRRSVSARRKGNGSLVNECLQWPIWIRLSWIFCLVLHLERTCINGMPGHILMDFSTLRAYHCP